MTERTDPIQSMLERDLRKSEIELLALDTWMLHVGRSIDDPDMEHQLRVIERRVEDGIEKLEPMTTDELVTLRTLYEKRAAKAMERAKAKRERRDGRKD